MTSTPRNDPGPDGFRPTRWTLVLEARGDTPEARRALGDLCGHYWQPVFEFLRREGRSDESARELAQAFFARVLAGGGFSAADPAKGRFRSFLLGALRHFLADERKRTSRLKRGGGQPDVSLDVPEPETEATGATPGLPSIPPPADSLFDRAWALAIMDRALGTLEEEAEKAGRVAQYAVLKPWIAGGTADLDQAQAARRLALSEGAVKVAIHRLRRRFRECVRAEIAQTVASAPDVDEELRYLVEVLSAAERGQE